MEPNGHMELDRIRLDDFRVKTPGGRDIVPHAGQSVWVYPYGRSLEDVDALNVDGVGMGEICGFLAGEIQKWDIVNYRTGEAYGPPSAETMRQLPDKLAGHIVTLLAGTETEGEGTADSADSPEPVMALPSIVAS